MRANGNPKEATIPEFETLKPLERGSDEEHAELDAINLDHDEDPRSDPSWWTRYIKGDV